MGKKKMMIKPMWKIMEKDILNYMQQPELYEQNIFKMQFIHPDKGINCFMSPHYSMPVIERKGFFRVLHNMLVKSQDQCGDRLMENII